MVACPQDRGVECEVELGEGLLAGPACTRLVFGWTLCCAGHGVIAGGRVASRIMGCNGHVVATGSSAGWENVISGWAFFPSRRRHPKFRTMIRQGRPWMFSGPS